MTTVTPATPKYLLTKAGLFKDHPDAVDPVIRCPECGRLLARVTAGWVCPASLSHTRIIPDWPTLAERVAKVLRLPIDHREPPRSQERALKRIMLFLRRRSVWMQRLQAGEDRISGREPPAFRDPAPEPAPPSVPPAERPYCPACRERDKVVLPSDPEPKHKRFAKPYCARCGDTLDRLPKHKLSPPDFD